MWTVTVAPRHQGEPRSRRLRPGGPCGWLEPSQAMTPGLQAVEVGAGAGCPAGGHRGLWHGGNPTGRRVLELRGRAFLPLGRAQVVSLYEGTL